MSDAHWATVPYDPPHGWQPDPRHHPVLTRFPPNKGEVEQCARCLTEWPCEIARLQARIIRLEDER